MIRNKIQEIYIWKVRFETIGRVKDHFFVSGADWDDAFSSARSVIESKFKDSTFIGLERQEKFYHIEA